MTMRHWLSAPAKVNLWLRILGRWSDGFHELDSGLALLELADELVMAPGSGRLQIDPPADLPSDQRNLAWQGVLAGFGRWPAGWALTLDKRIPAAAGLGGGSSDAAAAWRLSRRLLGGPALPTLTAAEASGLGRIGADVPFFAAGLAAARVGGMGEIVDPLPPEPPDAVLLVHPPFGLSTAEVFTASRPEDWQTPADSHAGNDLWPAASRLRPELVDLADQIRRSGGDPQLAGSGPTLWLRIDDPDRAAALASRLRVEGLRVTQTRFRSEPASIVTMEDEPDGSAGS